MNAATGLWEVPLPRFPSPMRRENHVGGAPPAVLTRLQWLQIAAELLTVGAVDSNRSTLDTPALVKKVPWTETRSCIGRIEALVKRLVSAAGMAPTSGFLAQSQRPGHLAANSTSSSGRPAPQARSFCVQSPHKPGIGERSVRCQAATLSNAPASTNGSIKTAGNILPAPRAGQLAEEATAYVEEHRIRAYEADPTQRTTIVTIANLLQVCHSNFFKWMPLRARIRASLSAVTRASHNICLHNYHRPARYWARATAVDTKTTVEAKL